MWSVASLYDRQSYKRERCGLWLVCMTGSPTGERCGRWLVCVFSVYVISLYVISLYVISLCV
jgi:hypothetical protein